MACCSLQSMFLRDVDMKLDRRGLISLEQDGQISPLLKKEIQRIPCYIFSEDGKTFVKLFLSKNRKDASETMGILTALEAEERKDSYVVTQRINNVEQMKIIRELIRIRTVVVHHTYVEGTRMFFDFRFHHTMNHEVSAILSRYTENHLKTRVVDLGQCRGLHAVIGRIQEKTPLTLVEWGIPLEGEIAELFSPFRECIVESENLTYGDEEFRGLVYSEDDPSKILDQKFSVISPREGIYEVNYKHDALQEVRTRLNSESIPRIEYFLHIVPSGIRVLVLVPSHVSEDYVRILLGVSREHKDWMIELHAIRKLEDMPFDSI